MLSTVTRSQLRARAVSEQVLRRALGCCLEKVSRGAYQVVRACSTHRAIAEFADEQWTAIAEAGRRPDAPGSASRRAAALRHGGALCASGYIGDRDVITGGSAAAVHGLPLLTSAPPALRGSTRTPSRFGLFAGDVLEPTSHHRGLRRGVEIIETAHPDQSARRPGLVRRRSPVPYEHIRVWAGRRIASAVWTAVDLSRTRSVCDGLVAFDALLRESADPDLPEQIRADVAAHSRRSRMSHARIAASWATGLADSPAESLCLYVLRAFGFTDIAQQVTVVDSADWPIGRVDFLLTERCDEPTIVEVDGAVKYRPVARGGFACDVGSDADAAARAVIAEKQREDRLRAAGYRVVRLVWRDLLDPPRVLRALGAAGVRVDGLRWARIGDC